MVCSAKAAMTSSATGRSRPRGCGSSSDRRRSVTRRSPVIPSWRARRVKWSTRLTVEDYAASCMTPRLSGSAMTDHARSFFSTSTRSSPTRRPGGRAPGRCAGRRPARLTPAVGSKSVQAGFRRGEHLVGEPGQHRVEPGPTGRVSRVGRSRLEQVVGVGGEDVGRLLRRQPVRLAQHAPHRHQQGVALVGEGGVGAAAVVLAEGAGRPARSRVGGPRAARRA